MLARLFIVLLLGAAAVFAQSPDYFSPVATFDFRTGDDLTSAESREPLAPDYKDPKDANQRPATSSFDASLLPGGVLDVDAADGFANPASISGLMAAAAADAGFGRPPPHSPHAGAGGGLFNFGSFFGPAFADYQPWWKGANVCIEREESTDDEDNDDEPDADADSEAVEKQKNETASSSSAAASTPNFFSTSISLSNCQQTPTKYECVTKINNHGVVKTFTVRYKCCYGYTRSTEGGGSGATGGCDKRLELKPLADTIESLDGKSFMEMVGSAPEMRDAMNDANLTVFLPTDAAIEAFDDQMTDMNRVEPVRRRRDAIATDALVRNHFVAGFVDLHDATNEQLLASMNDNRTIRLNVYPTRRFNERLLTANCVRVKKTNNLASNGIVHVLDGVMRPAMYSIPLVVQEHPKLSYLRRALEHTDVDTLFKDDGHYTLFAPTDEAFERLDVATREKLLAGKGCAARVLRHHVIGNTICSKAIVGNATTHNVEGELLEMERTADDRLRVEARAAIEQPDVIATNGVLHLVDTVLMPESALYVTDALKRNNITKFQKLVMEAEFADELDGLENATVFAPSDAAFDTPEGKEMMAAMAGDRERMRAFIKQHIVDGRMLETCEMENNAFVDTMATDDEDTPQKLRVNLYSTLPLFANIVNRATVNCARLTNFDERSCGAVVHEVDRPLAPVNRTIMEVIEAGEEFSTLRKVMNGTDVERVLSDIKRSVTFAAPDNAAFESVNADDMRTLLEDKEKASQVLKNHILTEVLCCAGVGPQTWGFNSVASTMAGQHQQVARSGAHQVRIGRATVTRCDRMARNGVVHTVNRVLFPQRPHHPQLGFFFFDF